MSFPGPFWRARARAALEDASIQVVRGTAVRAGNYIVREGAKAVWKAIKPDMSFVSGGKTWVPVTKGSFIPARTRAVAIARGPDGRPIYAQRAFGGGRTRIPLRFLRKPSGYARPVRVTPRFGFGGVAGSEIDVANFRYGSARPRRRSTRRPTRRVTRFSSKKRRTYRR